MNAPLGLPFSIIKICCPLCGFDTCLVIYKLKIYELLLHPFLEHHDSTF